MTKATHFMEEWNHRETGMGTRYNLQRHSPSDLSPPVKSHLIKFPSTSKIVPSVDNGQHMSL
jgi:hypothetical protein